MCLAVGALTWRTAEPQWLSSDIFDLLPRSERDALTVQAVETAERELSGRLLFLIGNEEREAARSAADRFVEELVDDDSIGRVIDYSEARLSTFADFYFARRRQMLTESQIAHVESRDGRDAVQAALASIYSPIAPVTGSMLLEDPFLLFERSMRNLQANRTSLEVDGGYAWVAAGGLDYALVSARTVSATLDLASQRRLVEKIEALAQRISTDFVGTRVLRTGFLFYSNAGAESARSEISLIGGGSLLGVIVLILTLFRSLRPLWLALLTIASGCLMALALTLAVFTSVHVFTLVFGASLIGVSIDYTFHYLAEEALGDSSSAGQSLRRVLPGITLGLVTSVVAYVALTAAPFPGLKELAVFSSGGLIGAYVTLLCCTQWFRRPLELPRRPALARLSSAYFTAWQAMSPRRRWVTAAVVAGAALTGILALEVDDDVSILQTRPAALERQEAEIGRLLGQIPDNAFLLARADSSDAVLELEEAVRPGLDELVAAGALHGYLAVSQSVPSPARQRSSIAAYRELVATRLQELFATLGTGEEQARAVRENLMRPAEPFSVQDWLEHPVSEELGSLWIGRVGRSTASIVLLERVEDLGAIRTLADAFPGVTVVDKASDLSALLGAYRVRVGWLLAAGYVAILLMLALRYGILRAAAVLIPPVLAGGVALAAASLVGAPVNLFNVLALILVLGIGIDYTLFLAEARDDVEATMLAITLAAITTILSFGLLALSGTFAIRSFGGTVLVGIACSYLLAPLALTARARS